jgi:hypothetical protein
LICFAGSRTFFGHSLLVTGVGDRVWNGSEYASATESCEADAVATGWWATAVTAATLLDGQHTLTGQQHRFLHDQLFGGMGSLQDFSLDRERWGDRATEANRQLERTRAALFDCLRSFTPT